MAWIADALRVVCPALVLGFVVAKLILLRPYYLERIRFRFWLPIARRMRWGGALKLLEIFSIFVGASLVLAYLVGWAIFELGLGPMYAVEEYPFTKIERVSPYLLFAAANCLAVFEEWIFRGILLEEFVRRGRSRTVGVIASAVIFALFHLSNPGTYPVFAVPALVAGILLGACYLLSGLSGAVLTHCAYNSIVALGFLVW